MIKNRSKLLNQYEKQSLSNVDEIIVRVKTIFDYFVENTFIYNNPFKNLKKVDKSESKWKEFNKDQLKSLFKYLNNNNLNEEFNFFKFALMTGLRRGKILNLTIENIKFNKNYIEVFGTKTSNSKRIIVIHKDLNNNLLQQIENKNINDFLFFNDKKLSFKYREEKIGMYLNNFIKDVLGEDIKENLNIHSFRKNFSQEIFLSGHFQEIEIKTLIGHSTSNDVTDKHYLRGLRDYDKLKTQIDKVNFNHYFN